MLNTQKYIFLSIALIMLIVPMSNAARLNYANENRECYSSQLAPGIPIFFCFVQGTEAMEASFFSYQPMHDYYTPQLREINISGGETYTFSSKTKRFSPTSLSTIGNLSYVYSKNR